MTATATLTIDDTTPDSLGLVAPAPSPRLPARTRAASRAAAIRHLASEVGQGTVEYVGLLLLMATVLAAIVAGAKGLGGDEKIGKKVVEHVGTAIDKAGGSEGR